MRDPSEIARWRDVVQLEKNFDAGQNAILKFLQENYPDRQEVLDTINLALTRHLVRDHAPWYRRLIAWAVAPLAPVPALPAGARRKVSQEELDAARQEVESRTPLALVEPTPAEAQPAIEQLESGVKYRDKRAPRGVE